MLKISSFKAKHAKAIEIPRTFLLLKFQNMKRIWFEGSTTVFALVSQLVLQVKYSWSVVCDSCSVCCL